MSIPLQSMSIAEKILTMELIWDDLSAKANSIAIPKWHENILNERQQAIKQGVEVFIDWNVAKKNLRRKLNEN